MAESTTRPSGVPGLVIIGHAAYGFSIYWESPDKSRRLAVEATTYSRTPNRFRLVRDAKAAAELLRPLMDWDTDLAEAIKSTPWEARQPYREQVKAALREAQREANHPWYHQFGAYDPVRQGLTPTA